MTGQAGGRADKLGNAYEKRWVVMQALRVLEGEKVRSLLWEALGDDERGVDLWVERAVTAQRRRDDTASHRSQRRGHATKDCG